MRLAKLSQFRAAVYAAGSRPKLSTLRARIKAGEIPGGTIEHGLYYVDLDEFERAKAITSGIDQRRVERAKNPLLAGLL